MKSQDDALAYLLFFFLFLFPSSNQKPPNPPFVSSPPPLLQSAMAVKKGKEVTASAPGSTSSGRKKKKSMCSKPESSGKGKKRRREGVLKLVDDAAVEDEDESDGLGFIDDIVDDDDENELDRGFMTDVKPGIKDAKSSARSRHLPFFLKEENLSIEEHEALINERYSRHVTYEDETKHTNEIFLHSSKDPTIWKVKCMIGHEQQIAFSLFQKFIDLHNFGNKLPISSVFALEHVKGCVYVEAEKEADVTEACRGFCALYPSKKTVVTKDEIPRLLSAKNTLSVLSVGTWVRVKSGNYKGDLAQVVAFDDQCKRAMVKLVPRIDLQALSKKFGGGISLKDSGIPTPRLISSRELEDFRPHIQIKCDRLTGENFEILDGMMLKEGYLYKKVSVASLSWLGVQPSRDELLKFEAAKMDDPEDLNWLSLVYGERKKARLEESNYDLETNRGSGYQLHDLVLFGRKDFGVIIGIKGDSIQILKGDTEGPQLATVLRKDIRTTCADKMFTALDRHRKTISINDTVKVLEGQLEGREGTVRHMYKGTLFLYDETQTENCGFFCAKSQLCLNIKQSKSSKNDKIGSTSSYVHPEEPMNTGEPSESRDFDSGVVARRPRRMDFDSPFSVGQTVRIRIGRLKGYLCRVIGIYRSKATVKLDSLAKVMSVNFTDLSEANIKNIGSSIRDTSTMISSGQFGSQDKPTDDRWGAPSGNNAWNSGLSATARDSWPGCSTSAVPVSSHNDDGKGDNARGTDPWSSNLRSKDPEQTKDMDCWDKGNLSTGGQSSAWNSSAGDVSGSIEEQTGGWEKDAGGWNKSGTDIWDKAKPINEDAMRSWDQCPLKDGKQGNSSDVASDRWEKKANNIQMDSWNVKESSGATRGASAGAWTSTQVVNDHSDSWDTKGKGITRNDDAWGKALPSQSKKVPSADNEAWEKFPGNASSGPSKDQMDVWDIKGKSMRGNEADTWCKSPVSRNKKDAHDDSGGWGKSSASSSWNNSTLAGGKQDGVTDNVECRVQQNSAHADLSNKWDKPANARNDQSDNWGKSNNKPTAGAFGDQTFESAFKKWDTMSSVHGDKSNSWEKPKVPSGGFCDNWSKARSAGDQETGGWQKAGTDAHGQSDRWGKSESSGNDQAPHWEKGADTREETNARGDWGGNWNKPNHFEGGRGYGQGRGRGRDTKGGDRDHFGGDQGSTWGTGRGQISDWNRQGNWSQPRDFSGNKGSSWGSGKNESGGNDRGSWDRSNNFNARGNKQEGGQGQDNSNYPRAFGHGGGWGRGDGHGWGRDRSSDWRNEQEKVLGSWGNEQQGSWGKSKSFDTNEGSEGADDQGNGWGRGKSVGCDTGGSEKWKSFNRTEGSDWNKGRQTADETYGITKQSSGWNNEGKNWNEAKKASVEQSGWNQEATVNESSGVKDKWDAPKPSGNQFSWNDKGNTWSKPERHGFNQPTSSNNKLIENVNSENETLGANSVWDKTSKLPDDGKGWGSPVKSSGWTNNATKPTDAGGNWEKMKGLGDGGSCWNWNSDSSEVGKEAAGSGSCWDRPKSYPGAKNSGWGNDVGRSWDKPKEPDGNESSGWSPSCGRGGQSGNRYHRGWSYDGGQSEWSGNRGGDRGGFDSGGCGGHSGNWNRGGRSYDGGESSEWSGNRGGGRGRGRGRGRGSGRNFNSHMGNQQNSYSRGESGGWRKDESSGWNQGKSFSREQPTGGFKGSSGQGGGWSTEKGILETPKSKDWQSSCWGSGSAVKEAGIGTWNQKYDFGGKGSGWNTGPESSTDVSSCQAGEWNKGNATEMGSWGPPTTGADFGGKGCGWITGPESSKDVNAGQAGGWNKNNASWGPPRAGADGQTAGWEKGSASAGRETGADKWSQTKGSDGNNKLGWNTGSTSSKDATNPRERAWETKSRNAEEVWNQEETQPTGSNADGNQGNAWEKSSGSWKKPKDGNSDGKGGW